MLGYTSQFSQLKIGVDPYTIHPFAIFDLESSEKGVLLPRLTAVERNQAFPSNIPEGLLLYNTDIEQVEVFTTSRGWQSIAFKPQEALHIQCEAHQLQIADHPPIDFSSYLPRPNQQLRLAGHILYLDQGGHVDLSELKDPPQQLSFQDSILHLDRGGTVNLASFFSKPQQLSLVAHQLQLENGGAVDLSQYAELPQKIHLQNTILQLDKGGSVDLAPLLSKPPIPQKLQLQTVSPTHIQLAIENGNSISLQASGNLILSLIETDTLVIATVQHSSTTVPTPFQTLDGVTSNALGKVASDHFLFGSRTMDNQTGAEDNSRFFFQKAKGAFRAGYASGASWDHNNLGDYSLATNYRTEAYGHRSVALGNATIAESFSETVLGSYNTLAETKDKDDWVPESRLLTVGNGSKSSARSDAVVILKNGNFGFNTAAFGEKGQKVIAIATGQAPHTATAGAVQLYVVTDTLDRAALMVMDSNGNTTEISPHRFELMAPSEPMAWSHYAKNHQYRRIINVDMLAALRELENIVGKPLVQQTDWEGRPIESAPFGLGLIDRVKALQQRVMDLENKLLLLQSKLGE